MPEPLVRLANVTKVYGSGEAATAALSNVCFTIERGSWVALMGPSGHGKSTLLHIMGGLDRPTDGQVYLNGRELTALAPSDLAQTRARDIGFVFQFFNLLPHLTALENIELALWFGGNARNGARAMALLDSVGLANKAHSLPATLSGGQQQRVSVARALANEPGLLLMDEPTGNLDSASEADLMQLLKDLHEQGRTLVVVTHNAAVARRAQRVLHVKDGRIEKDHGDGH